MNDNVVIDTTQLDELLNALDNEEVKRKILFDAVKAGAKVLKEQTISNLRKQDFRSSSMEKDISLRNDKDYLESTVKIKYKARWFEKGTKERKTKGSKITGIDENSRRYALKRTGKPRYTGSIKPHYFFRQARENSDSAIKDAITQSIDNALRNLIK